MIRIIKSYTLNYTFHSWDSICYTVFVLYVFVICIYRIAVCYAAKTMYVFSFVWEMCSPYMSEWERIEIVEYTSKTCYKKRQ